ncbi:MAG: response regulator [Roseovarius indicus]
MKAQLERSGHDVRTAHDAAQALATLDAGPLPEVVLTDIVMPGEMQCQHLADRIRQRYPGVEVILMSGYASEAQREAIEAAAGLPFLQKPIDVRTLRTIVGRATTPPDETGTGTPGA